MGRIKLAGRKTNEIEDACSECKVGDRRRQEGCNSCMGRKPIAKKCVPIERKDVQRSG